MTNNSKENKELNNKIEGEKKMEYENSCIDEQSYKEIETLNVIIKLAEKINGKILELNNMELTIDQHDYIMRSIKAK